jgi:hypothetical protein
VLQKIVEQIKKLMQRVPINKQVPNSKTKQEQNPKEQSRCSIVICQQVNAADSKRQASPK